MAIKPSHVDEPEQLRPPIIKGEGTTTSELYLARIAEKSFLNLWSYPSPYRDQGIEGGGDGKEVCDLLVVCSDHVIIFSEKTVSWTAGSPETAWRRWAKNAIRDAVKQIKGAERWITEHPDRVFLDRRCTVRFPLSFPTPTARKVHRIVVANGAGDACRSYLKSPTGSLIIDPSIRGHEHWPKDDALIKPFRVGDVDPGGEFVHVFNEAALDVVMAELDTITDLTDYLTRKEAFIRSGKLVEAYGEENLVAFYSIRLADDGMHDFVADPDGGAITIDRSHHKLYRSNAQYIAKKEADKISYVWDEVIESFTKTMLNGTSLVPDGFTFDIRTAERSIRYMALERRFLRRAHGEAVQGALIKGTESDRFSRIMLGRAGSSNSDTGFFIQTVKYPAVLESKGGYAQYRRVRSNHSRVYAEGILERHPHLKRVIGIIRESPGQQHGVSEDLLYMEQSDWSDEDRVAIRENCKRLGFLQNVKERPWEGKEFPEVTEVHIGGSPVFRSAPQASMNRQQRRAAMAGQRKDKP